MRLPCLEDKSFSVFIHFPHTLLCIYTFSLPTCQVGSSNNIENSSGNSIYIQVYLLLKWDPFILQKNPAGHRYCSSKSDSIQLNIRIKDFVVAHIYNMPYVASMKKSMDFLYAVISFC